MKKPGNACGPSIRISLRWLWPLWVLAACRPAGEGERPLVEVYGEKLYPSDIPAAVYREGDSAAAVRRFTDEWIRRRVFLYHARRNVDTAYVNRLVEAYRNDLLRELYENKLKHKLRDQIRVEEADLEAYYRRHRKNFVAEDTLVQWRFLILDAADRDKRKIRRMFFSSRPSDRDTLESYFSRFLAFKLDTAGWIRWREAVKVVPPLEARGPRTGTFTFSQKNRLYLVDVRRIVRPGQIEPYEHIKSRLKKFVVEQKLQEEVRRLHREMMEDAYKKQKIKRYQP
ncbi:MAG: hypothetical protein GXO27_02945 [Chlorobi bacterium]|nr:hypothetical protein [Chlorobiota bacterium]